MPPILRSSTRGRVLASIAARCAAPLFCAILALSCGAQDVSGFKWLDKDGKELAFTQSEHGNEGEEGYFEGSGSKNRYMPTIPAALPAGYSIAVDVEPVRSAAGAGQSAAPAVRVKLGASSEPDGTPLLVESTFPLLASKARFYLRADAGSAIASVCAASEGEGAFRITGISVRPALAGMEEGAERLSVSSGFRFAVAKGFSEFAIDRPFAGLLPSASDGKGGGPGLTIAYGPSPRGGSSDDSIAIDVLGGDGRRTSMKLKMAPIGGRTVLGPEFIPYGASMVAARVPSGREAAGFFAAELDSRDRELADLGRVLASDPPEDGRDYVLYRWDALPSVIVLVFKDYGAQDRYLKRLAFFVEKAGYRGALHRDEVIGPLHGWNAHDYRPEDLAAFFQKADDDGFPLSSQEISLGELLAGRGILRKSGGKMLPGSGALISISLESSPALRRTLLVHESTHAIFFADEAYRERVMRIWSSMSADEKWFWKAYFGWAMYDTRSDYLMANELQAYLLQQPIAAAREYFTKRKPDELLAKHPELETKVEEYMATYGGSFEARARDLEGWLSSKYGFTAGKTYFLETAR